MDLLGVPRILERLPRRPCLVAPNYHRICDPALYGLDRGVVAALAEAGYRTAFSYYGGVNLPGRIDRFNVLRIRMDGALTAEEFSLRTLLMATSGRQWF